jgi:hypothetical protein
MNSFGLSIFTCTLFFFTSLIIVNIHSATAQSHLQWNQYEFTPGSQVNESKGFAVSQSGNVYTINFTQNSSNHWFTYRFLKARS